MPTPNGAIIWTALPNHTRDGSAHLSVAVTPRLYGPVGLSTMLSAYPSLLDWPGTVANRTFRIEVEHPDGTTRTISGVKPSVASPFDAAAWKAVFRADLSVEGYSDPSAPAMAAAAPSPDPVVVTFRTMVLDGYVRDLVGGEMRRALLAPGLEPQTAKKSAPLEVDAFRFTPPPLTGRASEVTAAFRLLDADIAAESVSKDYIDRNGRRFALFTGLRLAEDDTAQRLVRARVEVTAADRGKAFVAEQPTDFVLPVASAALAGFEFTVSAQFAYDTPTDMHQVRLVPGGGGPINGGTFPVLVQNKTVWRVRCSETAWEAFDTNRPEFHRLVSVIGAYPELLRRLALVLDFRFDPGAVGLPTSQLSMPLSAKIRVTPEQSLPEDQLASVSPWTHFTAGELMLAAQQIVSFTARSLPADQLSVPIQTEDLVAGMRVMRSAPAIGYDFESGFTKIYLHRLQGVDKPGPRSQMAGDVLEDASDRLPSLRSVGMTVYQDRHFHSLKEGYARTRRFEGAVDQYIAQVRTATAAPAAAFAMDIYANDVLAGFRIDAHDSETGVWRSLCRRELTFTFGNGKAGTRTWTPGPGEGWIGTGTAGSVDEAGTAQSRISENLFRWDGWSLVAPRPILRLTDKGDFEDGATGTLAGPLGVVSRAEPKSLPRLRNGRIYTYRGRAVDIAGNSWSVQEATEVASKFSGKGLTTRPEAYLRHDPVAAPTIVALQKPGPGDKGDYLVVRTVDDDTERRAWLVVPPKFTLLQAEQAGMLDGLSADRSFRVLLDHDGELPDENSPQDLARYRDEDPGRLRTPYLPDICASDASFLYPPGLERDPEQTPGTGTPFKVPFNVHRNGPTAGRPYAQPFRLRIRSGQRATTYDAVRRLMTVRLPPGEEALVVLSSSVDPSCVEEFAAWAWAKASGVLFADSIGRERIDGLKAQAGDGQNWLVTPSRKVRLVNVVRRPIRKPVFGELKTRERTFNSRTAEIDDPKASIHRLSTSKVDVFATWTEIVDGPDLEEWQRRTQTAHAFECVVARPDLTLAPQAATHDVMPVRGSHQFEDTKYRSVRYYMVGMTQYAEYLPPHIKDDLGQITRKGDPSAEVVIKNSAPPASPKVVYILPTFGWDDNNAKGIQERRRKRAGGGLRIYLERPWFSSGDGEMVAVLFASAAQPALGTPRPADDELLRTFSAWGVDPIWESPGLSTTLKVEDLRKGETKRGLKLLTSDTVVISGAAEEVRTAATPPSASVADVDAVVFPAALDRSKRLVYADVEIDSKSAYWPFVRLSLARYQPNSIDLAHLSRPTIADFVQIAPDRALTVSYPREEVPGLGRRRHLRIVVAGPGPGGADGSSPPNTVEVAIEEWSGRDGDLDNWRRPRAEPLTLAAARTDSIWTWTGMVPIFREQSAERRRIVVSEFEHLLGDALEDGRADPMRTTPRRRLVYVDVVELPPIHFY